MHSTWVWACRVSTMRLTVGQVHMQYAPVVSVHGVFRSANTMASLS
jgi:hypothetical protein